MKILIVDDSRVMRQIVVRSLRQAGHTGHELVEAGDGVEGLRAYAAHSPELVLSDWAMPEMSGLELLTALRSRGDDVPFLFVTWERSAEVLNRAEAAGALGVVPKPFTADLLREALRPVLG
ncbi:MAG: two-component system, chemotaxis family, chemotaxis protein CheY [Nocardioidaceae bacterium]|jgi:two-component system chemotaxis response regulator CheY|nr:two-component system, chemotaxis family, chemotaxis protein CheY [Nocardioidaceae bacterium]